MLTFRVTFAHQSARSLLLPASYFRVSISRRPARPVLLSACPAAGSPPSAYRSPNPFVSATCALPKQPISFQRLTTPRGWGPPNDPTILGQPALLELSTSPLEPHFPPLSSFPVSLTRTPWGSVPPRPPNPLSHSPLIILGVTRHVLTAEPVLQFFSILHPARGFCHA